MVLIAVNAIANSNIFTIVKLDTIYWLKVILPRGFTDFVKCVLQNVAGSFIATNTGINSEVTL